MCAARQYYHALRECGNDAARMVVYPGQGHAISGVAQSADMWVNTVLFFAEHAPRDEEGGASGELKAAEEEGAGADITSSSTADWASLEPEPGSEFSF